MSKPMDVDKPMWISRLSFRTECGTVLYGRSISCGNNVGDGRGMDLEDWLDAEAIVMEQIHEARE